MGTVRRGFKNSFKHDRRIFLYNKTYSCRRGNPEIDCDAYGDPIQSNYTVFVKRKDCTINEKEELDMFGKPTGVITRYLNVTDAPAIPVRYGGTYYGYGEYKKRKSSRGVWIGETLALEYYTCQILLTDNGRVYTHTMKRLQLPDRYRTNKEK